MPKAIFRVLDTVFLVNLGEGKLVPYIIIIMGWVIRTSETSHTV